MTTYRPDDKHPLHVWLPDELYANLAAAALSEGRTLSGLVRQVLVRHMASYRAGGRA